MQSNLYEFQRRQIVRIVRVAPYAMVGHIANTAVIAIALVGSVQPLPLIIWSAYSCSTALLLLFRHVKNRGHSPRSFDRAAKKVTIYAFLLALPWSSLAILYLGSTPQGQELILVALGIGMAACATVLLSSIPRAAFSYMSVILIPSALKCLLVSEKGYLLLGSLALSYWGCLAALIAKTSRDIAERKRAEQALADLDVQRALAARSGLIGTYAYDTNSDTDAEKAQISPGYAAIHGLPEGTTEITRSAWLARVHPEDAERLEILRKQAFQQRRREYQVDYRIVRAGEVRWIESRTFISYKSDGLPQRVIGVNIDVTERKRTEALLSESKDRLADALVAGQVIAFEWDAITGRSQRSANAIDILGTEQRGATSSPRSDFLSHVHPDDRKVLKRHLGNLSLGNPSYALNFRYICPDSREVWLDETAKGEFDATGKLLRVKGLTRDITHHKRAEQALAERNAQLALAGKAALVGCFAYDVGTERTQVSEGYAAIHGLPEGATEITRNQWRTRLHPEDVERMRVFESEAYRERRRECNVEYRIVRSDGAVRWIESRTFISYESDGQPQRVVGVNIDVTARKQAEEHRKALNAELDHRVKNALATVAAVVSQTGQESKSVGDFVAALDGRIRSMAAMHELLSSTRWQGISLTELVRQELAPYAADNNTEIDGPEVILRPEVVQAIAMVLHELTTNAAKHGAFSNQPGRVSVRWRWPRNVSQAPLAIEWQETSGHPVVAPSQSGYGTSVIRELIPFELGGVVELSFAPDGIRCRLEIPADWINRDKQLIEEPGVSGPAHTVSRN